jgi:hypothetical protein
MDYSSRDVRVSSAMRGVFITGLILVYTWFSKDPGVSWKVTLLVAAGLQLTVIVIRRLVPRDELPTALYVFEIIADGVSVLMFALGVFGSIAKLSTLD